MFNTPILYKNVNKKRQMPGVLLYVHVLRYNQFLP